MARTLRPHVHPFGGELEDSRLQHAQVLVTVYGADWCSHTQDTLAHLDETGIKYSYVDVEQDPDASRWVRDHNNGMEIKPTLDIGGVVVTNPDADQLDA